MPTVESSEEDSNEVLRIRIVVNFWFVCADNIISGYFFVQEDDVDIGGMGGGGDEVAEQQAL
jgi:hypothetical protein